MSFKPTSSPPAFVLLSLSKVLCLIEKWQFLERFSYFFLKSQLYCASVTFSELRVVFKATLGAGQVHLSSSSFWLGQSVSATIFYALSRLRAVFVVCHSCLYHASPYTWIYNVKILNGVSRSIILWKIQSCDKKFLIPKRLVDMCDVGKVVPNKGEP